MEKKIVLSLACLLIGIGLAIAQTPKTVTGLVIFEEDNQPIVGASVLIKGTNQGAVTDLDGKFTLTNVPGTAKILRITYVGMQTIEVNIKSGTMKIVMKPDAEVLEEVVVTGMTKMDKRLFTGAATKLSSEDVKLDGLADFVINSASGDFVMTWTPGTLGVYGAANDKVSVFAFCPDLDSEGRNALTYKYVGETTRAAGTYSVDPGDLLPEIEDASDVRFVVCVSRVDGTMVSNSQIEHDGM